MKAKHPINLHKGLTVFFVLGLMSFYQNFSIFILMQDVSKS